MSILLEVIGLFTCLFSIPMLILYVGNFMSDTNLFEDIIIFMIIFIIELLFIDLYEYINGA